MAYTEAACKIGVIPADWACIYAQKPGIGMKYEAKVRGIYQKNVTIEVTWSNQDDELLYEYCTTLSEESTEDLTIYFDLSN